MASWIDNTGLLRQTGQDQGVTGIGGDYNVLGPTHMVEFRIDLTTLVDDPAVNIEGQAGGILDKRTILPTGAFIEEIEVFVAEAATSANSSAVLNIGTVDNDWVSNDDEDSLVDAAALAVYGTIGNKVVYNQGSTAHGILVGTVLTKPLYVTASYDTQVFTAGELDVRIKYNMNHQ
jgi:hypothetical protein